MRILEVARRKRHCYAVSTETEQVLLDVDIVEEYGLRPGVQLSAAQLQALIIASNNRRALNKASFLLSRRDYAVKELLLKLIPDFGEDAAQQAVDQLCAAGALDDRKFAQFYASYLSETKKLAGRALVFELTKKGIDRALAQEIAAELSLDPVASALEIVRRKYPDCLEDERALRRLQGALARRGYGYDEIRSAVQAYREEQQADGKGEFDE